MIGSQQPVDRLERAHQDAERQRHRRRERRTRSTMRASRPRSRANSVCSKSICSVACSTRTGDGRNSSLTIGLLRRASSTHHATRQQQPASPRRTAADSAAGSALRSPHIDSRLRVAHAGRTLTGGGSRAAARRCAPAPDVSAAPSRLLHVQDDLDVGAPILLATGLGLVRGDRVRRALPDGLEAGLGDGEVLDQVLPHRVGAPLRQGLVQLGRARGVGVALDAQEGVAERGHGVAERVEREVRAGHDLVGAGREVDR